MLSKKANTILEKKSKNELLVLAKRIGAKGYSKLSKEKLLKKLLLENDNHSLINKELGFGRKKLINNGWLQGFVFLIFSSLVGYGYFIYSPSKKDVKEIENRIDKNEQYKAEIEYLEKYKKKFLNDEMPLGYKVFGILDGKIIMKEELVNNSLRSDFESKIELNFDKREVRVSLMISEFKSLTNQFSDVVRNSTVSEYFPMKEDKPYNFGLFITKKNLIRFILLKEDREQPVFAVGIGTISK